MTVFHCHMCTYTEFTDKVSFVLLNGVPMEWVNFDPPLEAGGKEAAERHSPL